MNIERFALLRKNSFKEDLEYFSNIYRLGCKAFEAIPDCEIEKCIESKTIGNIWIERSRLRIWLMKMWRTSALPLKCQISLNMFGYQLM